MLNSEILLNLHLPECVSLGRPRLLVSKRRHLFSEVDFHCSFFSKTWLLPKSSHRLGPSDKWNINIRNSVYYDLSAGWSSDQQVNAFCLFLCNANDHERYRMMEVYFWCTWSLWLYWVWKTQIEWAPMSGKQWRWFDKNLVHSVHGYWLPCEWVIV